MLLPVRQACIVSSQLWQSDPARDEVLFPGCRTRRIQSTILGKAPSAGWSGMWKPAIMHRQKGHSGGFLCTSHRLMAQEQHIMWLHPLIATCISRKCDL